ncbi:TraR/DksA family transcriptional regulator [Kineococcus sp. SYSU DK002]|uniref:TraR/DksA family transcriptional regulator n=1 Tax=Kineococcus sp. SYSU DK002 TaxID=3383123 RepID=UPI003D7EBAA2
MTEPRLPFEGPHAVVETGPGWWPLITRLHESLRAIDPDYTVAAVKEKFGGLRYHADFTVAVGGAEYERAAALVRDAEDESFRVCEVCGRPGAPDGSAPWVQTLCPEHRG